MEQIRIVKEMREHERRMGRTGEFVRPRYMVWENVPGAFSSNGGRDFAAVLEEIIRIAEPEAPDIEVPEKGWPTWGGYHDEVGGRWSVAWRVHDAQHWGVPQRRRRISIVADFGGDTAGEISFERKSVRGDITEGGAPRKETTRDFGAGADCTVKDIICMATQQGGAELRTDDRAPTLTVAAGMSGNNQPVMAFDTTQITSRENRSRPEFGNPCHTLNASAHTPCVAFDMTHACDVIRECGEHAPSLTARAGTGGNQVPLTYQNVTGTLSPGAHAGSYNGQDAYNDMLVVSNEVSPALRAKANDPNREDMVAYVAKGMVVRRLTPLECERLQGYPDGWTDIGEWRDSKGKLHKPSDSPRYKACGNSIALPFWQFLAKRISAQYIRPITIGSLFDGIGGFPLVFERYNGRGSARWASEIEEFPMQVTKLRFGEE